MPSKRIIIYEFEMANKLLTSKIPEYPNWNLKFEEWDGSVVAKMESKTKTLTINTKLLQERRMKYLPFRTIPEIAAWLLTREIGMLRLGKETHEADLDVIDTPENRDAFMRGVQHGACALAARQQRRN